MFSKHKITFDNVIKQPNYNRIINANESKLFSYDSNILFGHNREAYKPSLFNYALEPEYMKRERKMMPVPKHRERESVAIGLAPGEQWKKEKMEERHEE